MRIGPRAAAAAWLILGLLATRTASSQTVDRPIERPVQPRIFHAPTAWLQPHGAVIGTVGSSHRLAPFVGVSAGLGGVAELDVQLTDTSDGLSIPTALFKTGVAAGRLGRGQAAVALGFRRSFAVPAQELAGAEAPVRVGTAQLSLGISLTLGPVDLHLGGDVWDAAVGAARLHARPRRDRLRPFAAVEWRPPIYPRTTVLLDLAWAPAFAADDDLAADDVALRWVGGWGIRYQALSWGAVELGVRLREGEGLGESTVLVRLSGFFASKRGRSGSRR